MTRTVTTSTPLDVMEELMNATWPALDVLEQDGWVLRSAGSVTKRANSVWPRATQEDRTQSHLRQAEHWYAARQQPAVLQLTDRPENSELDLFLAGQGYSRQAETLIMTAGTIFAATRGSQNILSPGAGRITLEVSSSPTAQWLELWCTIEGTATPAEQKVAKELVQSVPSLYISALDGKGDVVGTGRVSVNNGWGGIYCMGVHPDYRRRGIATAIVERLMECAIEHGASQSWLLVAAANAAAQKLYTSNGFTEVGRYHYRRQPKA